MENMKMYTFYVQEEDIELLKKLAQKFTELNKTKYTVSDCIRVSIKTLIESNS